MGIKLRCCFFIAHSFLSFCFFFSCVTQASFLHPSNSQPLFFFLQLGTFDISYTFCLTSRPFQLFSSLMSPRCDILRNAGDSALPVFPPLSHFSFLFTSSALYLAMFLSLPHRISHKKSLYMPEKYIDTSSKRLRHLSERMLVPPLFLGTNNLAAHLSLVEFKLRLVTHQSGCYRCSFIHLLIDFVFDKEQKLNRSRPNTAALMLINATRRDQRKIPGTFRGNNTLKRREKGSEKHSLFCF